MKILSMLRIPNFIYLPFLTVILVLVCCKKEPAPIPFAPIITLGAKTFEGKVYDMDTVTVAVNAPGGLKYLKISKFIGSKVDSTFGTAGVLTLFQHDYKLILTFDSAHLKDTIFYNMIAEDSLGRTGTDQLVITTVPSPLYYLKHYNWLWTSRIGQCGTGMGDTLAERIQDCEKDNLFVFSKDSTLLLNNGALSCPTDGSISYVAFHLSTDQTQLTLIYLQQPSGVRKSQVYRINSIDSLNLYTSASFDTTGTGCTYTGDWTINFKAKSK
jgi:hypothetical protein